MEVPIPTGTRAITVPSKLSAEENDAHKRNYLSGIFILLFVVVLWTSSSFITQGLFETGYDKPFLMTYLGTASFSLYLIPFLYKRWKFGDLSLTDGETRGDYESLPVTDSAQPDIQRLSSTTDPVPTSAATSPLTVRQTASLASLFCLGWFAANWTLNASLDYTTVASSTILASTSGFFTLAVGMVFRVEKLTLAKIGAVVTSFLGVLLVSLSDSSTEVVDVPSVSARAIAMFARDVAGHAPKPLLGDMWALLSAVFYSFYVILFKVKVGSESRVNMQLFFGFVGIFNVLTCWPMGLILHFAGVERLELPVGGKEWAAVIVNMAITLCSDYLYVIAMLRTSPLVVTIGLSLTIPLALVGDIFLGIELKNQALFGALLVLLSFVVIGMEDSKEDTHAAVVDTTEDPLETRALVADEGE